MAARRANAGFSRAPGRAVLLFYTCRVSDWMRWAARCGRLDRVREFFVSFTVKLRRTLVQNYAGFRVR